MTKDKQSQKLDLSQIGRKVPYLKAWAYLLSPPNLLDLAIKKEKIITKQKALAKGLNGKVIAYQQPYLP